MVATALILKKKKKLGASLLTGDKQVRQLGISPWRLPVEAADVQGIVFRGYGALPEACYVLLQVRDAAAARAWLDTMVARIAPGVPAAEDSALQIAFTYEGLAKLGVPEEALAGFAREFVDGMVGPHRSRFLGDVDESAPDDWLWGGPKNRRFHAVLMIYAKSTERLDALTAELRGGFTDLGWDEVRTLATNSSLNGAEHFGFADGISQPAIDGYHPATSAVHLIKPGEFVLGYENEYGLYTQRPLVDAAHDPAAILPLDVEGSSRRDLGRNGTFLVFRQLRQDVPAFRATLDGLTRKPDGSPDPHARELLAAQMIGRWPSGAPLALSPYRDDVSKARENEFRYHREDPDGLKCPLGAHVRRANPRDALDPSPGSERSLSINRRHRLIRRGRTYGTKLAEGAEDDGEERGLMFVAVNANISRQFEFVQHSWLVDPHFNGFANAADPIVGAAAKNEFAVPGDPLRTRCTGLPRFVTVAGGAYFFMPGIRALRFIARPSPGAVSS